jgi:DNA helicase-2/ATP-dependent DNA helicase PcrA
LTHYQEAGEILHGLNTEQREAVTHTEGPLLIIAGAGSGKTKVLTHRVAYLLATRKASPWSVLAITFTNKAAREMKERIHGLVGQGADAIWVSTFHAMGVRILRRDIEKIGYQPGFSILDAADQLAAVKLAMEELNIDAKKFDPRAVAATISDAKNVLRDAKTFGNHAANYFEEVVANVYRRYQATLRDNNALDFDDLIMKTVELFQTHPEVLAFYQNQFQYLHVDEYQDTNRAQYVLVRLLADKHQNLCVVGDSDQSIYRWRGADISNILNFEKDYPHAKVIKLEQNYRSTQTILKAANGVIANNRKRPEKNLWSNRETGEKIRVFRGYDERAEALFVIEQCQEHVRRGGNYSDIAILYRTNAQSRVIEEALLKATIPYTVYGGIRFYERKEIKDLLAYLRLIANPQDEFSLRRVINVPKRGIGEGTLAKVEEYARAREILLFEALDRGEEIGLSGRFSKSLREFKEMIENFSRMQEFLSVTELTEEVLRASGYRAELEKEKTMESESRLENLAEFLSVTRSFDEETATGGLLDFLAEVALVSDLDQAGYDATDRVTLMTLHSAKGLEFPVVFLIGMEERIFPHARTLDDEEEMEEERRLCYVGITRAEDKLYLTTCSTRTIYGRTDMYLPSRFLTEIPGDLLEEAFLQGSRQGISGSHRMHAGDSDGRVRIAGGTRNATLITPKGFGADLSLTWEPGERVSHRKWGVGVIVQTSGEGEGLEIIARFAEPVGTRRLLAKFAPIEKVQEEP